MSRRRAPPASSANASRSAFPADEQHAPSGAAGVAARLAQGVVGRREAEQRALSRQAVVDLRLAPQQVLHAPEVDRSRPKRRAPGVGAVERRERRQVRETGHVAGHQQRRRRALAGMGCPAGQLRAQARPADDDHAQPWLADHARRRAAAGQHDLAAVGQAGAGGTTAGDAKRGGLDRPQLHEGAAEVELREDEGGGRASADQPAQGGASGAVERGVAT
jgi:hypothetical protein